MIHDVEHGNIKWNFPQGQKLLMNFLKKTAFNVVLVFIYTVYKRSFTIVPPKIRRGGSQFWNLDKEGCYKNGGLVERGGSQIASSVFLKHVFITIEIIFFSGKYSHLKDLFFHVVYFLLENNILWNFFYS